MSPTLATNQTTRIFQDVASKCQWSEIYDSLQQILKRTAEQFPLLISYPDNDAQANHRRQNHRTVLFFARSISKKLVLRPLEQRSDRPDIFDHHPRQCTFCVTDYFKGLFEFVRKGRRCARIFSTLEQMLQFISTRSWAVIFMSRDRAVGQFQDPRTLRWTAREYSRGAIFHAQRIHRSKVMSDHGYPINNDYIECVDEDGLNVFLKTDQKGRFSLIAGSVEKHETEPEIFLYPTTTPNISRLIERVGKTSDRRQTRQVYIRLVRGPVPNNFTGQHFQVVCQENFDTLIGVTDDGLITEWNAKCPLPCRYAINLHQVMGEISRTLGDKTISKLIERARNIYRDHFQTTMQLFAHLDWLALLHYWTWTGDLGQNVDETALESNQHSEQFQFLVSIHDLHDQSRSLISAYRKRPIDRYNSSSYPENSRTTDKQSFTGRQREFFSQMSKSLASSIRYPTGRGSSTGSRHSMLSFGTDLPPFDDSIYESNSKLRLSSAKQT